jgi:hypothetical protein
MDDLSRLTARVFGLRDVVIRLLAYEARRRDDPEALFQAVAGATEWRIHQTTAGRSPTEGTLEMQEEVQTTVDQIVAAARKVAAEGTE